MGGVGFDEVVGIDVLDRARRRVRHPVLPLLSPPLSCAKRGAAAAALGFSGGVGGGQRGEGKFIQRRLGFGPCG